MALTSTAGFLLQPRDPTDCSLILHSSTWWSQERCSQKRFSFPFFFLAVQEVNQYVQIVSLLLGEGLSVLSHILCTECRGRHSFALAIKEDFLMGFRAVAKRACSEPGCLGSDFNSAVYCVNLGPFLNVWMTS